MTTVSGDLFTAPKKIVIFFLQFRHKQYANSKVSKSPLEKNPLGRILVNMLLKLLIVKNTS